MGSVLSLELRASCGQEGTEPVLFCASRVNFLRNPHQSSLSRGQSPPLSIARDPQKAQLVPKVAPSNPGRAAVGLWGVARGRGYRILFPRLKLRGIMAYRASIRLRGSTWPQPHR